MRTTPLTLGRARRLRKALNGPELGLWVRLRGRQAGGFRFRRQHPIGPHILDFCCPQAKLAVEIDGEATISATGAAHDARRDAWLRKQGIDTLRISAEIAKDGEAALSLVLQKLSAKPETRP